MASDDLIKNPEDRLALLYHLSQVFNSSLNLNEVLDRVMDEVISVTHAERGFVMLRVDNRQDSPLIFRTARGMDQKTIEEPQFQISRSVVDRVAAEGKPILTSDAQTDERFNIRDSIIILGLRSILCVPLIVKDQIIGVIYVDNHWQSSLFTQADLDLLSSIAASAAIALENARLYEVAIEKGRMERELQMARKVQSGLLPQESPHLAGWEFAARWKPAREVGGDYYDFIPVKGGRIGLVIADVTDKGMGAALFMASARSILRASMPRSLNPSEGIARANNLLVQESEDNLFVTLFYALLNPSDGEITYVNAGQNPPLLYSKSVTGQAGSSLLTHTSMQLGVDENVSYKQKTIQLNPGDFLVLYTDGVTDASNLDGQEFGLERLEEVILKSTKLPAEEIATSLQKAIEDFTGTAAPIDDITIVVVKRL